VRNVQVFVLEAIGVIGVSLGLLQYVAESAPTVGYVKADKKYIGHLDKAGNFVSVEESQGGFDGAGNIQVRNLPANGEREAVFEYRSARLVRGVLVKDGHFIPDAGSKVISFRDYVPIKENLRIYNLPGRFVEKSRK
jgi:hypothetical protein